MTAEKAAQLLFNQGYRATGVLDGRYFDLVLKKGQEEVFLSHPDELGNRDYDGIFPHLGLDSTKEEDREILDHLARLSGDEEVELPEGWGEYGGVLYYYQPPEE